MSLEYVLIPLSAFITCSTLLLAVYTLRLSTDYVLQVVNFLNELTESRKQRLEERKSMARAEKELLERKERVHGNGLTFTFNEKDIPAPVELYPAVEESEETIISTIQEVSK